MIGTPDMYEVLMLKHRSQPLRDRARLQQICIWKCCHKFITTKSRKNVHLAAINLPYLGQNSQNFVTSFMAVGIVNCLEVVYIQYENRYMVA